MAKELKLGVLFKGDISPTLTASVKQLNTLLKNLEGTLNNLAKGAGVSKSAMKGLGSEVSESAKKMGNATNETQQFQSALATLGSGKTGMALKVVESHLKKVEKAIQQTALRMNDVSSGSGAKFLKTLNFTKLSSGLLSGKLKVVNGELKTAKMTSKGAAVGIGSLDKNLGKASKSAQALQKQKAKLITEYSRHIRKLSELLPKLDKEVMSVNQVRKAMKAYITKQNESAKAIAKHSKEKDKLLRQYPQLGSVIAKVSKQVRNGNLSWESAGKHLRTLATNQKTATSSLAALGTQAKETGGAMKRLTDAFKTTVAYGAASAAIYAVTSAFKSGVQAIIDYDQGLKNLQAITGATDFEVAAMGETIKQVARDTKFSTSEAADGMTLLGQAGLNAGESMTAMRDTALLATGTLSDMKTSTDLVSTTIRAFGMSATESGRIVDVMANAVNKSKLTIDKLRTAFNYVAATSSQAGLSIEETAATMMTLANNGLRASTIGTGFRQVLSKMVKPSAKLAESLASVGLKLDDINPAMVGWQGTLKSLSTILYDTDTKTVNMSKAFSLFGLRGAQAAAVVVKSFVSGKYQDALNRVYEIGTAEEMAAKQAEGLAVKLKNLIDRAGNVAVAFGEAGAANGIRVFLDAVRGMLGALETFVGTVAGQVIVQLGAIAGSFKLATMAAKGFMAVLGKVAIVKMATSTYATLTTTLGKSGLTGALTTSGYMLGAFLKRLNPITIALGVVAAAVLAYKAALAKSIKDAETLAVKNMQIVDSLEAYKGALVSTGEKAIKLKNETDLSKGANDAYLATLKRLIKAHPELKDKIELTIDAFDKNNKVLDEFASAAHIDKLKALGDLINEYGYAVERSKAWSGFLQLFADSWKMIRDETKNAITAVDGYENVIVKLGDEMKSRFPIMGSFIKLMGWELNKVTETVKISIGWWKRFFVGISEDSKKTIALQQKHKDAVDAAAVAYSAIGEKAKLSYGAIKRELEATGKYTDAMIAAVIKAVEKGRVSISKYAHDVRSSLDKMSAAWKAYYDKQDIDGKVAVKQAWERLQKRYKNYVDELQKMVAANEISKQEMAEAALSWWNKELENYKANQEKQTGTLNNELEKRKTAYQKFTDKIKSIEEKLAEDVKLLRQSEMTDEEIQSENILAARQALAEAKKAISEAETEKDYEEALERLETARELYRGIADAAISGNTQVKQASRSTTETITAESIKQADAQISNANKAYNAMMEIMTRTTANGAEENKRRSDLENAEIAYMEEQRNEAAQRDMQRVIDTYGANSKELENYKRYWVNVHGEAEAAVILGLDEIKTKTSETFQDGSAKAKTAYDSMETEAGSAFGEIGRQLANLKEKFNDPAKLKTDIEDPTAKLNKVKEDASKTKTKVEEPMNVKVDSTSADSAYDGLSEKEKEFRSKLDKQYLIDIENREALSKIGFTKEAIDQMSDALVAAIAQGKIGIDINTANANAKLKTMTDDLEAATTEITQPKIFNMDIPEVALNDITEIKTTAEAATTAINAEKTVTVATATANTALDTTTGKAETLQTTAEKEITVKLDGTQPNEVLDEIKKKLEYLISKDWKSKHVITVIGLEALREAYNLHRRLGGMNTTSTHTVSVKGKGSTTKPISEKIKEIKGWMDGLKKKVEGTSTEMLISFMGEGSSKLPLSSKITNLKKQLDTFKQAIELAGGTIVVDFGGKDGDSEEGLTYAVAKAKQQLESLKQSTASVGASTTSVIQDVESEIASLTVAIEKNKALGLDTSAAEKKLKALQKQLDTFNEAKSLGITTYKGQKLATGGQLKGYGGGDTIPAMLEKGEFVIRKEAVAKYGSGLFEGLNGMVQKFASGGRLTLPKIGSKFTGVRPTAETKYSKLHSMFGDPDALRDYVINKHSNYPNDTKYFQFTLFDHVIERNAAKIQEAISKHILPSLGEPSLHARGTPSGVFKSMIRLDQVLDALSKLSSGGQLKGYGGGDTVPAMLEKGEFVIKKEAVKKYGSGLFEGLNGMVAGMKFGGVVPKMQMPKFAQGGPVGGSNNLSGQLHTINLNINDTPHQVYGDTDAVNGLVKTLRRAQLVTA